MVLIPFMLQCAIFTRKTERKGLSCSFAIYGSTVICFINFIYFANKLSPSAHSRSNRTRLPPCGSHPFHVTMCDFLLEKQRGRDSNPRWNCSHTTFPRLHLKPLGHLSALFIHRYYHKNTICARIFSAFIIGIASIAPFIKPSSILSFIFLFK